EGNITLSVGISADGTVTGIAFTELNETPGLGSLCGEPAFKDQFLGVRTDWFALSGNGMVIDGASAATGTADTASGATGTADTASGATGTADAASGATGTADAETGATASSDSVESVTVMTGSSTEIDGVSGATKSSRAVVNAINAALDFFRTYKKGGM
ncbi:MAG: FMN-binding protein, partial [Oscillospiraceae bacterium]|nr:FMN-binding protein [Oscillospiraceae bacterium]